jgi:hypothetical protein
MMRLLLVWAALAFASAGPACAAWNEASSKHFIVYADLNPKVLSDFSSRLERFDQAARLLLKMDDPAVGDGNRLNVYVLPTDTPAFTRGERRGRLRSSRNAMAGAMRLAQRAFSTTNMRIIL